MTESSFAKAARTISPDALRLGCGAAFGNPLIFGRLQVERDGNGTWTEIRLGDIPINAGYDAKDKGASDG